MTAPIAIFFFIVSSLVLAQVDKDNLEKIKVAIRLPLDKPYATYVNIF